MAQILELRVHGVSNTSPAEILCMEKSDTEDPHPTRVAGDDTTGFYRESARDPTAGLTTEAYSWGQLTSGARAAKDIERALWTVLLPFTLANIALPARTGIPADPVTERWSSRAGIAAWLIRLFCLSLTGTLVLAATGIGVDLIGWQCVDAACLRRIPGSWEFLSGGWWGAGARSLALGLLVPLAMLAVIGRLTWRTYQYEAELPAGPAGAPNTAPPVNPLQDPTFWCGEGQVRRAAVLHLCAGVSVAAAVPLAAVLHMDPPQGARAVLAWGTVALFALPAVITLIALGQPYLTRRAGKTPLGPWSVLIAVLTGAGLLGTMTLLLLPDGPAGVPMAQLRPPHGCLQDPTLPGCLQDRSLPGFDRLLASFGAAQALLLIAIGAVSRCGRRALALPAVALLAGGTAWCWRSDLLPLLPAAPQWLTTSVLAVATLGLAAAGLLLPRVEPDQHGDDGAAWHGLGPAVLATLGWLLGIAYSAGMIYWTTDWLNGGSAPAGFSAITAPQPIGWAGLVYVIALAAVIVTVLRGWALYKRLRKEELAALAPEGGELSAHERRRARDVAAYQGLHRLIGEHALTLSGHFVLTLALLALAGTAGVLSGSRPLAAHARGAAAADGWAGLAQGMADVGGVLLGWLPVLVAAVGLLLYRHDNVRRSIGVIWDVGTFWPRAAHPLAPPSYAERAVPQLQTRAAGLMALAADDPRRMDAVILSGHSQGAVLSAAAVLQMPAQWRRRTWLFSYGCQLERLYGRVFPAFFGPVRLRAVAESLCEDGGTVRWTNFWRRTDPLGWPVDAGARDVRMPDPQALHPSAGEVEDPPIRSHGDYPLDPAFLRERDRVVTLLSRPLPLPRPGSDQPRSVHHTG